MLVDTNYQSLSFRREKHTLDQMTRVLRNSHHPLYQSSSQSLHSDQQDNSFSARCERILQKHHINLPSIQNENNLALKPWTVPKFEINIELGEMMKNKTSPIVFKSKFLAFKQTHKDSMFYYTDGSKCNETSACAFYSEKHNKICKYRLPDHSSSYSAELTAINYVTTEILQNDSLNNIIVSDSLSALHALRNKFSKHFTVKAIFINIKKIYRANKKLVFYFVPSHIGIYGNEIVDNAAKNALSELMNDAKLLSSDYKKYIRAKIEQS